MCVTILSSPDLPRLQFLIACSMQKMEGEDLVNLTMWSSIHCQCHIRVVFVCLNVCHQRLYSGHDGRRQKADCVWTPQSCSGCHLWILGQQGPEPTQSVKLHPKMQDMCTSGMTWLLPMLCNITLYILRMISTAPRIFHWTCVWLPDFLTSSAYS